MVSPLGGCCQLKEVTYFCTIIFISEVQRWTHFSNCRFFLSAKDRDLAPLLVTELFQCLMTFNTTLNQDAILPDAWPRGDVVLLKCA